MDGKLRTVESGPGEALGEVLGALAAGVIGLIILSLLGGLIFWWLLPVATAGAFTPGFVQCVVGYLLLRTALRSGASLKKEDV